MMQKGQKWLVLVFLVLILFIPASFADAQQFPGDTGPSGIVPCGDAGEPKCGACQLVALAQDGINFGVYFSVFVATLMIVFAGFKYVTAGGDSGKISDAHKIFRTVIVGLIIILAAWLIVDLLMKTFLNEKLGPWNTILCEGSGSGGPSVLSPRVPIDDLTVVSSSPGEFISSYKFDRVELVTQRGYLLVDDGSSQPLISSNWILIGTSKSSLYCSDINPETQTCYIYDISNDPVWDISSDSILVKGFAEPTSYAYANTASLYSGTLTSVDTLLNGLSTIQAEEAFWEDLTQDSIGQQYQRVYYSEYGNVMNVAMETAAQDSEFVSLNRIEREMAIQDSLKVYFNENPSSAEFLQPTPEIFFNNYNSIEDRGGNIMLIGGVGEETLIENPAYRDFGEGLEDGGRYYEILANDETRLSLQRQAMLREAERLGADNRSVDEIDRYFDDLVASQASQKSELESKIVQEMKSRQSDPESFDRYLDGFFSAYSALPEGTTPTVQEGGDITEEEREVLKREWRSALGEKFEFEQEMHAFSYIIESSPLDADI